MDVGVDVRLKDPGDSDLRVDEPLLCAKLGVGGGRFCVDIMYGSERGLKLAIREFEVACTEFAAPTLGKYEVDKETAGRATPRTDPAKGSLNRLGLLLVSYCLPGSYEEAEESARANWAC